MTDVEILNELESLVNSSDDAIFESTSQQPPVACKEVAMGKRKDSNLAAIRRALDRAYELGDVEMDWLGTGSSQRHADAERANYLNTIGNGIAALNELHGTTAGVDSTGGAQR